MKRSLAALLALTLAAVQLPADEPVALKPTPLPVNTDKDEDDPHVTSDDLGLYFVRTAKDRTEVYLSQRKKAKDAWPAGKLFGDLKTKTANVRSVFVTPEGKYPQFLYFASDKDPAKKGQRGDNYDLYFLTRPMAGADWSAEAGLVALGTEDDELHPWLSAADGQMYFSRKEKDGWHVYAAPRKGGAGQFQEGVKLDLPADFHHATLTPDGKTMYLQGPVGDKGDKLRWGLYRSTLDSKTWSKPEPLTALNNAEGPTGDRSPCLSRDGTMLYFASDRPGGKGGLDLYVIPTKQLAKKK